MKFNFRKVSAILSSAVMLGASVGVAAAASYPAPFIVGGTADVAIVYGTGSGVSSLDLIQAGNVQTNLQSAMPASGTSSSSTVTGGDSVLLSKSSDNLNLNNSWSVFTGTIDDDDLSTLLADGTYIADDNDEFDFEQKINLGAPVFNHFRDSDYESLVGLASKTPTLGFKINSNTYILNYTIEFLEDVTSDVVNSRMDDIEGSDMVLMGKNYYVSEFHNSTSADGTKFDKAILLDSAVVGNVREGETATVSGKDISIDWIDADEVVFMVDGERAPSSGKLQKGNSYKLNDGTYIGVRDISKLAVSGEVGSASFSVGTGKLEISHGADIKLNDNTITGLKGYLHKTTNTKLDKIVIEWKTNDEIYLSPKTELTMPGFKALKFSMNDFVRNKEEKITLEKDSDTSLEITMPFKDGEVSFNALYTNASGEFTGIGKSATERLLVTNESEIIFYERLLGNDYHKYFIATYNISKEGESYLLRAQVTQDASAGRNETTIQRYSAGAWVDACTDKAAGDTCDIGDVSLTISSLNYTSGGDESVNITAGTNVNFHTAITPGGLVVYLPYTSNNETYGDIGTGFAWMGNTTVGPGAVNFVNTSNQTTTGHNWDSVYITMVGEDKDETLGAGTGFSFTINDNTDNNVQVQQINTTGGDNAGSGTGGVNGLELQDTSTYEAYVRDDVAPRILHYTQADEDSAEVYYPTGESESYAEVYLAESSAVLSSTPGSTGSSLGEVLVKDTEVSSVSSKNLVIVGGSCINSAAAKVLGGAYCSSSFTDATGIGSGEFLIKGVSGAYTAGKIALVVAGYEAADTVNAAKFLTTQTVDTSKEYKGTSATAATLVTTTA